MVVEDGMLEPPLLIAVSGMGTIFALQAFTDGFLKSLGCKARKKHFKN